jgi:dimeric dUTPase (all-alpha-NTP-PPase superfamily)
MDPMTDSLQKLLDAQDALQSEAYDGSPSELLTSDVGEAVNFIHWNVTALTDELHELLGETSWKPWAKGEYVNLTAAKGELIDALHFLMNLAIVLNMDSEEIQERYFAKRAKNIKRQEDGYDGVSTKCPGCRRALDDDGVDCHPARNRLGGPELIDGIMCVARGRFIPLETA